MALERLLLFGEAEVEQIVVLVAIALVEIEVVVVDAFVVRVDCVTIAGVVVNVILMPMGVVRISPLAIAKHCFAGMLIIPSASLGFPSASRSPSTCVMSNRFSFGTELLLSFLIAWDECPMPILKHEGQYGKNVKCRRKTVTTIKTLKAAARR